MKIGVRIENVFQMDSIPWLNAKRSLQYLAWMNEIIEVFKLIHSIGQTFAKGYEKLVDHLNIIINNSNLGNQ